ncbi:hypothetical protein LFM09_12790 [Lentzea alba]|uniref:hypothetical protein n=1 Tax=Lentzea alba TaxID=2714351 RepID=UPI0039BEE3DB
MTGEPQVHNEVSGAVHGNVVQAGQVRGDITNTVKNINNVHQNSVAPMALPQLNPWLVHAGVLAVLAAAGMVWVAGTTENQWEFVGIFLALWLVWSASDLWIRKRQARQAARNSAQFALYVSLIPFNAAVGVSLVTHGLYLAAAGSALICLLCSPMTLRRRPVVAVLTGVVACACWYGPQLALLWGDRIDASVLLKIFGAIVLLVVIVLPVHAVLTAPGERAARVLRSWAFCLFVASTATRFLSGDNSGPVIGWAPLLGVIGMLVLAGHVKDKP